MGGGNSKPKAPQAPPEPAPTPQPVAGREEEQAKTKVKSRIGGRASTIFAGRMNERNTILHTKLG